MRWSSSGRGLAERTKIRGMDLHNGPIQQRPVRRWEWDAGSGRQRLQILRNQGRPLSE